MADIRIGIDVNDGGSTAKVNKNAEQLKNTLKDVADIASKIRVPSPTAAARQGVAASQPKSAAYMAAAGPAGQASDTNLGRGVAGATGAAGRDFAAQAQGLGGLVHVYATFAANLYAVSAGFTALSKAMDLSNMVKGLDQLGASSGRSLGGLAKQMVLVADGAISMRDAMNSTALASAGGMSNANILRMTEVAKKASLALGRDLPDSMDRLTKGIVKTQPELLDELGIMTRVIPAQEAYARQLGKTASSLTDFEKKQAFANAVLAEGERKFSAIDLDANPYSKILASMSNLMQTGLELINKVLSPVLTLLSTSPTALALAMAGIGAILLKQAIPAIGMFREQAKLMQTETTARVQKQINEQQIAAGVSDDIVRRSAETKFRIEQAGSKKIGELQRQDYTKATVGKEVKGLLRKNPLDLSDDERTTIENKYQDLQKKIDTNTATAAQKSATTQLGNRLKFHNELLKQQEDAGNQAIAAKVAEDQRFYSHETLRAQQLKKLKQAEAKAGVLASAADNAAVMGPLYAFRQLREETNKLDASGVSKFFTKVQGGFSILTSAVGNLINVYGMWAMAAGVVYGLLDSYFTKNAKEMEALSQASGQLDSALDNINSTIKAITANKDPLHFISVEASNARANALQTVVEQMDQFSKKTKEAIEAQRGWDKSKNWIKGLFGASVQDEGAQALAKSISAAFKIATEGPERAKAAEQVKKLLNINIDPSSLSAVKTALDSANYAQNADELYKITNEMSHSISNIASSVQTLNDSFNTAAKSYDTIMVSLLPTDNIAKLGFDLIKTAQGFDKALEKPADAISEIAKTSKDMSRLKLLDPEFAGLLMQGSTELTEMATTYSKLSKEIKESNDKQMEYEGEITAIRANREKKGGTLLPVEKRDIEEKTAARESLAKASVKKAEQRKEIETTFSPLIKQFSGQQYEVLARGAELVSTSLETSLAKGAVALSKAYAEGLSGTSRGIDVNAALDKKSIDIDIAQIKAQLSLVEATDNLRRVQEEILLSDLRTKAAKATGRELVDLTDRINKLVSSIAFGSATSKMNTKQLVEVLRGKIPGDSLQVPGADLRNRGTLSKEGPGLAAAGAMAASQSREAIAAALKGKAMEKQAVDVRAGFAKKDIATGVEKDIVDVQIAGLALEKARLDVQSKSAVYASKSLVSAQIENDNAKAQLDHDKSDLDFKNRIDKAGKDSAAVEEITAARIRANSKFNNAQAAKAITDAERLNATEKARLDFAQKLIDIKSATLSITAGKELTILEDNLNLSKELGTLTGEEIAQQTSSLLIYREKERSIDAINALESARKLENNDYEKKSTDLAKASLEDKKALDDLYKANIEKIDASLKAEKEITANKQYIISAQKIINTLNGKLADKVKLQEHERALTQNVFDISTLRLDVEQQLLQNQKELNSVSETFYVNRKADIELSKLQLSTNLALLDSDLAIQNAKERSRIANVAATLIPTTFKGPEGVVVQQTEEQNASKRSLDLLTSKRDVLVEQAALSITLIEASRAQGLELEKQNKFLKEQESFAQSLTNIFGDWGTALGGTVTSLIAAAKAQEELTKQKKAEIDYEKKKPGGLSAANELKIEAKYRDQSTKQELTNMALISSQSKKLFGEKTVAYRLLNTLEKTSNAIKLAMEMKTMAISAALWFQNLSLKTGILTAEVAATGAAEGAIVAEKIATAPLKVAADAPSILSSFSSMGPVGYAIGAALVASLLAMVGGGGGGSPASVDMTGKTSAEKQASAGTGGVFGDDSAKSESISKSIDILANNSIEGLDYDDKLLKAFTKLSDSLSVTSQAIYNIPGLRKGGTTFGTQPGEQTTKSGGLFNTGFLNSVFGGATTANASIASAGIKVQGSLQNLIDDTTGSVTAYKDVLTQFHEDGGWFGSDRDWTTLSRQATSVGAEVRKGLSDVFKNAKEVFTDVGEEAGVGVYAINNAFASINFSGIEGEIDTMGLTGQAALDQLNAVIGAKLDQTAHLLFGGFDRFKKFGEGYLETVVRVIDGNHKVDQALRSIGSTFKVLGSFDISETMIKAAGGLEKFMDQASFFKDNFLTDAQKLAPVQKSVSEQLTKLHIRTDISREDFRKLVLAQDLSGLAGQNMYQSLMELAPGFDTLIKGSEAAAAEIKALADSAIDLEIKIYELKGSNEALNLTRKKELDALDASLRPRQKYINALTDEIALRDKLKSAYDTTNTSLTNSIKALQEYKTALVAGASSTLSPAEKYAQAKAIFNQTATAAQAVITTSSSDADIKTRDTAISNLSKTADSLLANSSFMYASGTQYVADFDAVSKAVDVTSSILTTQQTEMQEQLGFLDTIAKATDTTAKLLEKYLAAVGVTTIAQAAATASGSVAAGVPKYASGGLASGISMVGEQGPELVDFANPGRVYSNNDSKNLFNNDALVAEVRSLREEVAKLREDQREQTGHLIATTFTANARNAETINNGNTQILNQQNWKDRSKVTIV